MFTPLRRRDQALFLTGLLAGISAAGCSKPPDRQSSAESAASTPADRTMSDSSATPADTSMAARTEASAAPTAPAAPKPAAKPPSTDTPPKPANTPPLPKPNMDPGRKPPTKPADTSKAAAPAGPDQWLKYDAGSNTVTFELVAGPFNFNGYTSGGATLTVPPKANVVMNFVNKDGTPHSAEIISGEGPVPNAAVDPAIPRAYTNKLLEGLPQEASDVMRFSVPESGTYRIFCGVPGHGLGGMWIWMKVDAAAKAPSFGPTKG